MSVMSKAVEWSNVTWIYWAWDRLKVFFKLYFQSETRNCPEVPMYVPDHLMNWRIVHKKQTKNMKTFHQSRKIFIHRRTYTMRCSFEFIWRGKHINSSLVSAGSSVVSSKHHLGEVSEETSVESVEVCFGQRHWMAPWRWHSSSRLSENTSRTS